MVCPSWSSSLVRKVKEQVRLEGEESRRRLLPDSLTSLRQSHSCSVTKYSFIASTNVFAKFLYQLPQLYI